MPPKVRLTLLPRIISFLVLVAAIVPLSSCEDSPVSNRQTPSNITSGQQASTLLTGRLIDTSGAPVEGVSIHLGYKLDTIIHSASQVAYHNLVTLAEPDESSQLLTSFSIGRQEYGSSNYLSWELCAGCEVVGFKIYSDEFLTGFYTKINDGLLSPDSSAFTGTPDTNRKACSVLYILGIVLPDQREIQYAPISDPDLCENTEGTQVGQKFHIEVQYHITDPMGGIQLFAFIPVRERIGLYFIDERKRSIFLGSKIYNWGGYHINVDPTEYLMPSGIYVVRMDHPDIIVKDSDPFLLQFGFDDFSGSDGRFTITEFSIGSSFTYYDRDISPSAWVTTQLVSVEFIEFRHPSYDGKGYSIILEGGQQFDMCDIVFQPGISSK